MQLAIGKSRRTIQIFFSLAYCNSYSTLALMLLPGYPRFAVSDNSSDYPVSIVTTIACLEVKDFDRIVGERKQFAVADHVHEVCEGVCYPPKRETNWSEACPGGLSESFLYYVPPNDHKQRADIAGIPPLRCKFFESY